MPSRKFNLVLGKKIKSFKKTIKVDPDKSISIRSFLIGSISQNISSSKNILESEDVLSTIKCLKKNAKFKEVEINYKKREGQSRGLPLKIIPTVIVSTIKNSFKIKKQICYRSIL